ncbi:MAG: putative signal transducing protein [Actinomycetota bacterium]
MTHDPSVSTGARWVPVTSFLREDQARLAAGRLEAEGIPSRIYPEEIGTYYGSAVEALMRHGIDVLVPEDRLLEAREILEALDPS